MTLGGTTLGGSTLGGSGDTTRILGFPSRSLSLSRGALTAAGDGTADVALPARSLTLTRSPLGVVTFVGIPARTLSLKRDPLPTTATGVVSTPIPSRALTLTRGVLSVGYTEWGIDGEQLRNVTSETATPERLSLTSRVSRPTLRDVVRPLRSDEGKYRVFADDSGGYRAVDTADGNNTFVINAPIGRVPLRPLADEYHVDRYEEEIVETTGDEWDVTLELVPDATRDDDATITLEEQTPDGSSTLPAEWYGLDSVNGTIATDRVDADVTGVGEGGVDRATLTLKLTFGQAYALETALAQNRGTRVRTIEDGTNRAVDETANGSNTLTITSPDEDTLPSGEYVVVEPFESTWINNSWQEVELEIVPTA